MASCPTRSELKADEIRTVWFGVGGSTSGTGKARAELRRALDDPEGALADKLARRTRIDNRTAVDLPGNPLLEDSVRWSKQMLAASEQRVNDLELRWVEAGKRYPPPEAKLKSMRWLGAGWPDYTWLFGTDGEYTAYAAVAAGQFAPIKAHLRALRDVSVRINGRSGKIVHEVTPDGAVYFGANEDPGNTDESSKYPSAVALVWRWTGDERFLRDLYPASRRAMKFVASLDADEDGWPEGLGTSSARDGRGEAGQRGLHHPRLRGPGRHGPGAGRRPDPALGGPQGPGAAGEVRGRPGGSAAIPARTRTRWGTPTTRRSSSGTGSG